MNFSDINYGTIQWSSEKGFSLRVSIFSLMQSCPLSKQLLTNHIICPVLNMIPMGTTSPKYRRAPPESIYNHLMGTSSNYEWRLSSVIETHRQHLELPNLHIDSKGNEKHYNDQRRIISSMNQSCKQRRTQIINSGFIQTSNFGTNLACVFKYSLK